jgi:predicted ATPase
MLMRLYAQSGQRAAALRQYKECERLLQEELEVEPHEQTQTLHEAIRSGELDADRHKETLTSPIRNIANHNLPARVTSFIGREKELAELEVLLADPAVRVVTIVGPGGMGKTRLAVKAAKHMLERAFAETWLVELAPVADPSGVPLAVASALGAQPLPDRELTDVIADSLQTRDLLLVVDNCEHLLTGTARLVSHLLSRCPELSVLATSREALRIPGEHIFDVPPMCATLAQTDDKDVLVSDAVRLFTARAAAVRPGFSAEQDNAADVTQICRRLDGMPLAIELAAARLRTMSLQDIAARLDDRFALLNRGIRIAESRQQTLRNAVAWSYELLDEEERTLFGRLSVFCGGFTVKAAESVCAGAGVPKGVVLDLLASLVDKSMVAMRETDAQSRTQIGGGGTRYELLETMRQYASERLAAHGEVYVVTEQHARHYADFAEEMDPQLHAWEDWGTVIPRLHAEVDNFATAMRWSLANDRPEIALRIGGALREWFWTHPYGQQFIRWTQDALEADTGAAPQVRAKALNTVAAMTLGGGDLDLVQKLAREAVLLARRAEDPKVLLRALYELGRAMAWTGQTERAVDPLEQSRDISLEYGHHIGAIEASTWLAHLKEPHEQRARLAELLPKAPYTWQAYMHQLLGGAYLRIGDLAAAEGHFEQALQRWGEAEILPTQSIMLYGLGLVAMLQGDGEQAYSLLLQAIDLGRRCGHIRRVIDATVALGRLSWRRGELDAAWQRGQEALALAREHSKFHDILSAQCWLAYVACARGNYDRAEELGRTSLEGYAEHQRLKRSEATMALARVALCRGEAAHAVELYRASLTGLWPADRVGTVDALEGLGWALAEDGQQREATQLLAVSARERDEMGIAIPLLDQSHHKRALGTARGALDETAFATAWAEGEALSLGDAVARVAE